MKHNQFLEDSGIIHIGPDCKVKTDSLILMGFKTITTVLYKEILPSTKIDINVTAIMQNVIKIEKFNIPKIDFPNIINFGQNEELEKISFSLEEIESLEEKLLYKLSPLDFKQDIFSLIFTISIITIFVLLMFLRYAYKKGRKMRALRIIRKMKELQEIERLEEQQHQPTIISPAIRPRTNFNAVSQVSLNRLSMHRVQIHEQHEEPNNNDLLQLEEQVGRM